MTVRADTGSAAAASLSDHRSDAARARLRRRHAAERRFRLYGLAALLAALSALAFLFVNVAVHGYTAFLATEIRLSVELAPEVIDPDGARDAETLARANYRRVVRDALRARFPEVSGRAPRRALARLVSSGADLAVRDAVLANPDLIGTTVEFWVPADDDIDMLQKGRIDRDAPESERRVNDRALAWVDSLDAGGDIRTSFNTRFLTAGDSREPELAGIRGALTGSLLTLFVTLLISFPIAVGAAVYLEEFAPRNRWTTLIEVNINNLAAVPSIVFGLLGLAVFLNVFGLPRSAPLVGGMTLALMTLPTIIIAGRAALLRGAAFDSRGGAGHWRLAHAGGCAPRAAAGDARHPHRHHHRPRPRARRNGTTPHDRHGRVHRRRPAQPDRPGDRAAGSNLPVGRQPRTGLSREDMGGDTGAAGLSRRHERTRGGAAPPLRATLVGVRAMAPIGSHGDTAAQTPAKGAPKMAVERLNVFYGDIQALVDVTLDIGRNQVIALIGPSGCGKSTFLRCLNRMNDTIPNCHIEGRVTLDGENIYAGSVDVVQLRARVGMVFQKPNPFPKSIYDNVAYGPRIHGLAESREALDEIVATSLEKAGLWTEVRDRLSEPGTNVSGGQQQRLCIARAIAVNPDVILMDEPCSALDPIATARIEELMDELKVNYTIVIVTHSMQQAARVSQRAAFFHLGELVEQDDTTKLFTAPTDERTKGYITGRFG